MSETITECLNDSYRYAPSVKSEGRSGVFRLLRKMPTSPGLYGDPEGYIVVFGCGGYAVFAHRRPRSESVRRTTPARDLSVREYASLNSRYVELLNGEIESEPEYRVLPGVHELLDCLVQRTDVVIGLQTGNIAEAIPAKLGRGKLNHYFKVVGCGDDSHHRAEIIRAALVRVKETYDVYPSQPTDVFVIGDSPQDIEAALTVGARPIGVATGVYSVAQLQAAGSPSVLHDLSDLAAVVSLVYSA